jgi:hypothetical protein
MEPECEKLMLESISKNFADVVILLTDTYTSIIIIMITNHIAQLGRVSGHSGYTRALYRDTGRFMECTQE